MSEIHETAVVSPLAQIGDGVSIGPFCVIEDDVRIGDGTEIRSYVEVRSGTVIGDHCYIDSRVSISGAGVLVDDGVTLRYGVILARGTVVGRGSYLCPRVMTNNLDHEQHPVGGPWIGSEVFIGTHSVIHHGKHLGNGCVIAAMSFVNRSVPPGETWAGIPAKEIS